MRDQRGVVYLEMLIGILPTFLFFYGTLQVADASMAHLVVEHAATTAVRAAVVVLPDDGAYYEDVDNDLVDQFRDYRQSDVERAADTILAANPRLGLALTNVALDKPSYAQRELVTARVTVPYRCLVPMFCPGGIRMSASAQLVYQGARYEYEPSTGWASAGLSRGIDNIRGGDPGQAEERPRRTGDGAASGGDRRDGDRGDGRDGRDRGDDRDGRDRDERDSRERGEDRDGQGRDARDRDPFEGRDRTAERPRDEAPNDTRRGLDELRRALPRGQRQVPITHDPTLPGSTVRVHYTHDARGVITGVEVRVGRDAGARHIADHVPTIRVMQRYQGLTGRARALLRRANAWLTGHPTAGPGTRAWEARREIEKLNGIIDSRTRELESPSLTAERRAEIEREIAGYERQLADHQATLDLVTTEPGEGYVAAEDPTHRNPTRAEVDRRVAEDLDRALTEFRDRELNPEFVDGERQGTAAVGRTTIPGFEDILRGGSPLVGGGYQPAPRISRNDNARDPYHAEVDVVNRFLDEIEPHIEARVEAEIAQLKAEHPNEDVPVDEELREALREELLTGHTLYIHVEQPPCGSCAAGNSKGRRMADQQGAIKKLAERYPGLRIVLTARDNGAIKTSFVVHDAKRIKEP